MTVRTAARRLSDNRQCMPNPALIQAHARYKDLLTRALKHGLGKDVYDVLDYINESNLAKLTLLAYHDLLDPKIPFSQFCTQLRTVKDTRKKPGRKPF